MSRVEFGKDYDSEEYRKKVMRTLEVYKPLYKEHMNKDITFEDAEEIRENLVAFGKAILKSIKEKEED